MAPTLLEGDELRADNVPESGLVAGQIVVYDHLRRGEPGTFIHRVVAIAGDTVAVSSDGVTVNGASLTRGDCPPSTLTVERDKRYDVALTCNVERSGDRSWQAYQASEARFKMPERLFKYANAVVPDGHVYVLGDFRDGSEDSRVIGPVAVRTIRAVITAIDEPVARARTGL